MEFTTTPLLMMMLFDVSPCSSSIQTTTISRQPGQQTKVNDTTTVQPQTTNQRDVLSDLNYSIEAGKTKITTKTERDLTTLQQTTSHTTIGSKLKITKTTVTTESAKVTLTLTTNKTSTKKDPATIQQTTSSTTTRSAPKTNMTTVTTEPTEETLTLATKVPKPIKTTERTTTDPRGQEFGQSTLADKSKQVELFLSKESLLEVTPTKGSTTISDSNFIPIESRTLNLEKNRTSLKGEQNGGENALMTDTKIGSDVAIIAVLERFNKSTTETVTISHSSFSPFEDRTLDLESNQTYLQDAKNGNENDFDNDTKIGSDIANIFERFNQSTTESITDKSKAELPCSKLFQANERNKTKLDSSGTDIQILCNNLTFQNETKNQSKIIGENEVVQAGQTYSALALVIVGFVVMLLNGLVLTICKDSRLRKNVYLTLVLGLALNDFVLGFVTCIGGLRLIYSWINSLEICIEVTVLGASCLLISLYQSFLISLHRFLVLSKNDCSNIFFKAKRKYFVCLTGWVLSIASVSAFVSPISADNGLCYHAIVFNGRVYEVRIFFAAIITTLIFTTLVLYCSAMYTLRGRYLEMSSTFLKSSNTDNNKQERATNRKIIDSMKMVTILLVALYVFSGPFAFLNMANLDHEENKIVYFLAFAFAVLNSLINPILYYFNISEFKKRLKKMCCNLPDNDSSDTNGT